MYTCRPPLPFASQIDDTYFPPLQEALMSCLIGHSFPEDHCGSLIRYDNCKTSFAEWSSAHHLLVLAVKDGKITPSTTHNGKLNHWFDNLYIAAIEIDFASEEDLQVAKRCLHEAKSLCLVE